MLYALALILEIGVLYGCVMLALFGYIKPVQRILGMMIAFPLAGVAAWWGARLAGVERVGCPAYDPSIIKTLPVQLLIWVFVGTVVVALLALLHIF